VPHKNGFLIPALDTASQKPIGQRDSILMDMPSKNKIFKVLGYPEFCSPNLFMRS
jgi:hypothetical protein